MLALEWEHLDPGLNPEGRLLWTVNTIQVLHLVLLVPKSSHPASIKDYEDTKKTK